MESIRDGVKMTRTVSTTLLIILLLLATAAAFAASPTATVNIKNPIDLTRISETVVLKASELQHVLNVDDVRKVHVRDDASGAEILIQAVDNNDDGTFDDFIF